MYDYSSDELHRCFGGRRIVFAGDSTMRQTFFEAAKKFDLHILDGVAAKAHQDVQLQSGNVTMEFIWDPWLDSQRLGIEVADALSSEGRPKARATPDTNNTTTSLLLVGAPGLWSSRYGADNYLETFQRGMSVRHHKYSSYRYSP
ncbi:N-acetylneuraminate 9-O-acetyltransferase [Microdochium nivale]|nr:N-acetylneuraminate 9-O-acetyltransferase [Microdochium nivale]